MNTIDNPQIHDNRKYVYNADLYTRAEFPVIAQWVPEAASVIDLGCGNGALMEYLIQQKQVVAQGLEISPTGVAAGQARGLRIRLAQIDKVDSYASYANAQFDYAICNVTLQMVLYPEVLLEQMKRIAKHVIVSFPNFAYIGNRFDLLVHGVMPRDMLYGYTWYNTGHIHQLSIRDFKMWSAAHGLQIIEAQYLGRLISIARVRPNLLARVSVFLCQKQ